MAGRKTVKALLQVGPRPCSGLICWNRSIRRAELLGTIRPRRVRLRGMRR
jgi:hypothetical protein